MIETGYATAFLLNEKDYPTPEACLMDRGYSNVEGVAKHAQIHGQPFIAFALLPIENVPNPIGLVICDAGRWRAWFSSQDWIFETEAEAAALAKRSNRDDWRTVRVDNAASLSILQ